MRFNEYNEAMQELLTALADPTRRAALAMIWPGGEHCVCDLMTALSATQSRVSRHMRILRQAGIVIDRRDAQWVRYRRNPQLASDLVAVVDAILTAEANAAARVQEETI